MISRSLVVSLLLTASLAPAMAGQQPVGGQVTGISGNPYLITSDGKKEAITTSTVIPAGCQIYTDDKSTVSVSWVPGASSLISCNSAVGVTSLNPSKEEVNLNLLLGSIANHVLQSGSCNFNTTTPKGVIPCSGTYWQASCGGGDDHGGGGDNNGGGGNQGGNGGNGGNGNNGDPHPPHPSP